LKGERFAIGSQLGILGCTAGILPPIAINGGLEGDAIELAVTDENHVSPMGHYPMDAFQQLHVGLFREMPLVPLNDDPGKGQRPFLVDYADHQGQALPSRLTAVHGQEQREGRQTGQQGVGVGQEVALSVDALVLDPTREPVGPAWPVLYGANS